MAVRFKWTPQAVKGLNSVLDYLEAEWTFREILQLEKKIKQVINQIGHNPEQFPQTEKDNLLYKAIVDKNNYLVYRINISSKTIEIINFRGTKQKPKY
ncbi:type II toxin-antitoxin system RelE/ParE family toxin [Flavobacterium sp. GA093]|uniref:Type II toxin-antitoxin system RelE/ParE family toxin n=1 Tax=Flavobacterium hydrocarbonoxydans TaxID=2683249 RepID=A0A6I4NRH4_9FLAO|nr:type II toxin-antitoxin system RelE/ParE family toxin [Flavobacterium hydrocarbonoxydans]MWB96721.1 type II toxin-antitoxin system RelE/ParE family toxin [Flavobacterium hydrocarbonoxydans]